MAPPKRKSGDARGGGKRALTLENFFSNESRREASSPAPEPERVRLQDPDDRNPILIGPVVVAAEATHSQTAPVQNQSESLLRDGSSSSSHELPRSRETDISALIAKGSALSDSEKAEFLSDIWRPDSLFNFPASGKRNLKFQHTWLGQFKWLVYSPSEDGAFCVWCALFSSAEGGKGSHQHLGQLVKTKFSNWKNSMEAFKKHELLDYHISNKLKGASFLAIARGEKDPVKLQIDTALKRQIEENRARIKPIIDTVIFCGRQGLALRGHRDSGRVMEAEAESEECRPEANDGNFRALLRFRVESGDSVLEKHLLKSSSNAMYTSSVMQNEIISSCNDIFLKKLVSNINAAKGFSVIADETTDISSIEQLSICVRYLHDDILREDFLQFVPVTDVSGRGLGDAVLANLEKFGIDCNFMFGQGYDGAAAMSGSFKGAQAIIRERYPLAVYVHCASHSFNLTVSDACDMTCIANCMGTVKAAYDFFRYPKRQHVLTQAIERTTSSATRLKSVCATRWVERHDCIFTFIELMAPVIEALLEISRTWKDKDTLSSADRLHGAVLRCDFLISLYVLAEVFTLSLPLSRQLQKKELDLKGAMNLADGVKGAVQELRDDAEAGFKKLFSKIKEECEKYDVEIYIPRRAGRQAFRSNVEATTPEEYYRRSVYIPFLDSFLQQIHERLLSHKTILSAFSCLVPRKQDCHAGLGAEGEGHVKSLWTTYNTVLECCEQVFVGEMRQWYRHLDSRALECYPQNVLAALQLCSKDIFPGVRRALEVFVTIPVTSVTAERSFSTLRRLKTYLRNTCGEDRLNGLALLYIHREVQCTPDEVLNHLALNKNRRLQFKL